MTMRQKHDPTPWVAPLAALAFLFGVACTDDVANGTATEGGTTTLDGDSTDHEGSTDDADSTDDDDSTADSTDDDDTGDDDTDSNDDDTTDSNDDDSTDDDTTDDTETGEPLPVCGNMIVEDGEDCDDGEASESCDGDCTIAECGDSTLNAAAGEACDDGEANSDELADACRSDCSLASCGDAVVDTSEACDDGNDIDDDGCNSSCEVVLPGNARVVNGLTWYRPDSCGVACNDVCAAEGLVPADAATWLEAQNEEQECQALADAFGYSDTNLAGWAYACLEETPGDPLGPLYCSVAPSCPQDHLTQMDALGLTCVNGGRKSLCPCE